MALTWATCVRFGRATRRTDCENEAHLSTNTIGGLGHRLGPKTLISMTYLSFYVFIAFVGFFFLSSFWPKCVLRPVFNLRYYLYGVMGGRYSVWNYMKSHFYLPNH
ncbi:hypothetical protein Hanom_Chr15g01358651 [Helianthus anomalus]